MAGGAKRSKLVELGPAESAPVLKLYATRVPITRPFFDATPDSDVAAFAAEASRHPVFRIFSLSPPGRGLG